MSALRILGVVPARMAAARFPGKPLVPLAGRPLVQWVYEGAVASNVFDDVVVATPDDEIAECVRSFGGAIALTGYHHETGTDRVAEVAAGTDADVVVNVQGDQPFVDRDMLAPLIAPYRAGEVVSMSTLACPLADDSLHDPNVVKVVVDRNSNALYFSRSPIPYQRAQGRMLARHHLGLYAFDRTFLAAYSAMLPTPLEHAEGLEQLRALEHGYRIRVCDVVTPTLEVNTPEDLERAEAHVAGRGHA